MPNSAITPTLAMLGWLNINLSFTKFPPTPLQVGPFSSSIGPDQGIFFPPFAFFVLCMHSDTFCDFKLSYHASKAHTKPKERPLVGMSSRRSSCSVFGWLTGHLPLGHIHCTKYIPAFPPQLKLKIITKKLQLKLQKQNNKSTTTTTTTNLTY